MTLAQQINQTQRATQTITPDAINAIEKALHETSLEADGYARPGAQPRRAITLDPAGNVIPDAPTTTMTLVERAANTRANTSRMMTQLAQWVTAYCIATQHLAATVAQITRALDLTPDTPPVDIERCAGGWGDTQHPCDAWAISNARTPNGVIPCCRRCIDRSRQADHRAGRTTIDTYAIITTHRKTTP
jgi:hypothetical protein